MQMTRKQIVQLLDLLKVILTIVAGFIGGATTAQAAVFLGAYC